MLNRAPFNTEVPQFVPSRDAPINSYIIRKYPCQERLAGKVNEFRTLTWKIQQPDSSMVWQSVKVVMPMEIMVCDKSAEAKSMAIGDRLPPCNMALSQSPMNAFRQTSLSINGRIFSEDNFYRDILDACYRGVGAQAYGDNHSLKPIVYRAVRSDFDPDRLPVLIDDMEDGYIPVHIDGEPAFVLVDTVEHRTASSTFNLLEHNGPFIERARIFQDNLIYDGEVWEGEISHLLELGPFQARARKGNSAVPYIQDFHLRMNFQNMESKFDVHNPELVGKYNAEYASGRTMAPKLLEFATLPNFLHAGEDVFNRHAWPAGYTFRYTAQPYLEVVYTKHEAPMRDSYNLRCFEHLYEKSNRFALKAPSDSYKSPTVLSRVTSRLLSLPTKIYVWAEISDEYKYAFAMGGVRRSCLLENLHLRVNQRPDVMFNPSQEECYEMFRRHTNSNLEYGSWLKSPIYCFDMVDVGQPDMFSNDARIAWFEWDAAVSMTKMQMIEQNNLLHDNNLAAHGYDRRDAEVGDLQRLGGWLSTAPYVFCWIDNDVQPQAKDTDTELNLVLADKRNGETSSRKMNWADGTKLNNNPVVPETSTRQDFVYCDWQANSTEEITMSIDGCIWARVLTAPDGQHDKGEIILGKLYYIPTGYRFVLDDKDQQIFNTISSLTFDANGIRFTDPGADPYIIKGHLAENINSNQDDKPIGKNVGGGATWSPGEWGYEITGNGIQNAILLHSEDVQEGGGLPVIEEKEGQLAKWICFGPSNNMKPDATGNANWLQYAVTKTTAEMNTAGCPLWWAPQVATHMTEYGLGTERLNIKTSGKWGTTDPEVFNKNTRGTHPYGYQMVGLLKAEEVAALEEDFQLKVLYEYGNCQYNFRRDAAPTRVLPNVVPVGPSPGLPQL